MKVSLDHDKANPPNRPAATAFDPAVSLRLDDWGLAKARLDRLMCDRPWWAPARGLERARRVTNILGESRIEGAAARPKAVERQEVAPLPQREHVPQLRIRRRRGVGTPTQKVPAR